jgi:hypothetical protein
MPIRERFFECIFTTERNEYRFHIRAWNAQQALEQLRDELRGRVTVAGEVRVLLGGKELLRLPHAPVDGAMEDAMPSRLLRVPGPRELTDVDQ